MILTKEHSTGQCSRNCEIVEVAIARESRSLEDESASGVELLQGGYVSNSQVLGR